MHHEYAREPKQRAEYDAPWYLRWTEGNILAALIDTWMMHSLFLSLTGLGTLLFVPPTEELVPFAFLSTLPLLAVTAYVYYRVHHYYNPIGYKYSLVPSYRVHLLYAVVALSVYYAIRFPIE